MADRKDPENPRSRMRAALASLDDTLRALAAKSTDPPDHVTEHARWRAQIVANTARFQRRMDRLHRRRRPR